MATIYVDENLTQHPLGNVVDSLPIGSIVLWPGSLPPSGWKVCNGDTLYKTDYPDLFDVLEYRYGGSGNSFNLPDFRGRTPVGVNDGTGEVTTEFTLASTGGEVTHTLTEDEMPSHHHNLYTYDGANPSSTARKVRGTENAQVAAYTNGGTEYSGGGQAHNNMQPYLVVNYIIKVSYSVAASGSPGGGGDASSDIIIIGQESDVTEDTKLLVEPEDLEPNGSEVVNTLENNESTKAPSVRAVNKALEIAKNIYSTSKAVRIGTWIDGKPLYRKVLTGTKAVGTDLYLSLNESDVNELISVPEAKITRTGDSVSSYVIPFYESSTVFTRIEMHQPNHPDYPSSISIKSGSTDFGNGYLYVVVHFTKNVLAFEIGQNYAGKTMHMTFPNNTTFTNYLYNLAGGEQQEATIVGFGNSAIMANVGAAAGTVFYSLLFYPDISDRTNSTTLYSATYTNSTSTWNYLINLTSFTFPAMSNCTSVNNNTNATSIIKYITIS